MGADAASEGQFGPYLIYERLGVGGMATVHRALERGIEGFERTVALKRLLPHLAADGSFIKSFVREAKLASLLNHVNIVKIFELGRVGTEYFISMEYIDGRDIRRILRHARKVSGPPPIHVTVGLLLQLCDALDYAHHQVDEHGAPLGIVHRDVSPSNVLVTSSGQVKVIDFGIAKAQSVQLRTQTGRVKGKLAYMAPEALAGRDLDARSDLFAVGVIAHELLTARPLFATKNEYQTLMKVQRGEIQPPSTFNQACPAELDAIVLRALARDPDERFAHVGEMRDELHAMRKPYNLQTAAHDIATWLDWAFSLAAPDGNFTAARSIDPAASAAEALSSARRGARPKKALDDDDDSLDIAWGADEGNGGAPVLLDDVPDVSAKHLAHDNASAFGAEVKLDFDDLDNFGELGGELGGDLGGEPGGDLGGPGGPLEELAAMHDELERPDAGAKTMPSGARLRALDGLSAGRTSPTAPSALAAPGGLSIGAPGAVSSSAAATASLLGPSHPRNRPPTPTARRPRLRTITIPPLQSTNGAAPSTRPSLAPPPPVNAAAPPAAIAVVPPVGVATLPAARRVSGAMPVAAPRGMPVGSSPPANRKSTQLGAVGEPRNDDHPTERNRAVGRTTPPPAPPVPSEDDDDIQPSDTVRAMPAMASESGVRFRAPSVPPTNRPAALTPPQPTRTITPLGALFGEPDESRDDSALLRRTTTAEGVTRAAVPASGAHAQAALLDASRSQNPASRDSVGSGRRSVRLEIDPPAIVRPTSKRRVAAMIGGVAALATVGVVGTLWLARPHTAGPQVQYVSAAGAATPTGTLELSILPTDAKITISGLPSHVGSPWRVQLEPGVHQIEIHREGYMAWLTSADILAGQELPLRITLEPLGVKVIDANPTLALTAPPGHEVLLDGVAVASTAIRNSLTVGTHTIALRKHGVEIWQTQLDAKASAVYDLTPILTKQAEQHATDEASAGSAGSAGAPNGEIDMAAPAEPASSPPAAAPEDAAPSAVK